MPGLFNAKKSPINLVLRVGWEPAALKLVWCQRTQKKINLGYVVFSKLKTMNKDQLPHKLTQEEPKEELFKGGYLWVPSERS